MLNSAIRPERIPVIIFRKDANAGETLCPGTPVTHRARDSRRDGTNLPPLMESAITVLEIALHTMETNEPINRREGNLAQPRTRSFAQAVKYRTLQDIVIPAGTEFTASGRQARAIPFGEALVIVSLARDYAAGFVLPADQPGAAVFQAVEE